MAFAVSRDNRIVEEVAKINCADDGRVILLLARCLPHIVPNVILAKREVRLTELDFFITHTIGYYAVFCVYRN